MISQKVRFYLISLFEKIYEFISYSLCLMYVIIGSRCTNNFVGLFSRTIVTWLEYRDREKTNNVSGFHVQLDGWS